LQSEVMALLDKFEDYGSFNEVDAELKAEEVAALTGTVTEKIEGLRDLQKVQLSEMNDQILSSYANLRFSTIWLSLIVVLASLVMAWFLSRSITRPIVGLQGIINDLSKGVLPNSKLKRSKDETGDMVAAMNILIDGLRDTSNFAENIGGGQLDAEFTALSDNDLLGNSLIAMRDNLKQVAKEDDRRNWANEGYAQFSEILRNNENSGLSELSSRIVSKLVKYLKVNQGWLYIVEKENDDDDAGFLHLTGVYAYDKEKFIEQKILKGEGLTGQCWQEGEMIYMNDVPHNYTNITSGLGAAGPTSVLIVPLKVNDEIYGVLELSSFNEMEEFEIAFIERVAENIASTISVTKINERTKFLLEESQVLAENMRSQEEEMRQNFEELQSTQEELTRREKEQEQELLDLKASQAKS
jgi:putative methionine-R-sulfoxide reductase with GAF domain/HAMP domain-containing protein